MVERKSSREETPIEREIRTRLQQKFEKETREWYARIAEEVETTTKALEIELKGVTDEKARQRQLLRHAKMLVKKLEPNNRMHIFLFKSTTGRWWKLGGNSVAIHRLMISPYLDRTIKVNVDRDNFAIFRNGVICLQDELRLEKDIYYTSAQMTRDEEVDFGVFEECIRAYRMAVPLEAREIRRYAKLDEEIIKNINNNVFAAAPDVELNNSLTMALRTGYQLEKHVDSNARGFVGHPLLDSLFAMRRAYYDVANSPMKSERRHEAMKVVNRYVGDAMSTLANYADLNIVNRSEISRASLELAKTREIVEQKISQYEKRNELKDKLEEIRSAEEEAEV